ncbi:MAG: hypothetical protein JXN62_13955 [Bacteroidales bacterium]|nr:hypothetical protein [Bacteroidales bacterium]
MNHILSSVEINYLAESIFIEEIVIRTSFEDGNREIYNDSVFKSTDNRKLCRVRLRWKTKNPA